MKRIARINFSPPWLRDIYSVREQKAFKDIAKQLRSGSSKISVDLPYNEKIESILLNVYLSDPLLFDVGKPIDVYPDGGHTVIIPKYLDEINGESIESLKENVESRAYELFTIMGLDMCKTDLEKELAVNEWMVRNCTWYDGGDFRYRHSVLGILLDNKGVCISFAQVAALMLQMAEVPCYVVTGGLGDSDLNKGYKGYSGAELQASLSCGFDFNKCIDFPTSGSQGESSKEKKSSQGSNKTGNEWNKTSHAWNFAKVEGMDRHLDVTFDAGPLPGSWPKTKHNYFNLTTQEISSERTIYFGPMVNE